MFSDKLIIIALTLAICILGFVKIMHERKQINIKHTLALDFMGKIKLYIESRGEDLNSYGWLIHRSNRMQSQLGRGGIYASYKPSYANFQYTNYPIILNMLPELRKTIEDPILSDSQIINHYSITLQDTLIRHLGTLDDLLDLNTQFLRNPVIWLREGVRTLTAFPLRLLTWLGALSETTLTSLTNGTVFKAISTIVSIIGLISAVMGIALGWKDFTAMVLVLSKKLL